MIRWDDFLEVAKTLRVGDSCYTPHRGCTTNSKMWVYNNKDKWGCYCNKCGDSGSKKKDMVSLSDLLGNRSDNLTEEYNEWIGLPDDFTNDVSKFHVDGKMWLYKAGIRNDMIRKYNIGYSKSMHRIILPVYSDDELVMWQGRGLDSSQTKYYNVRGRASKDVLFKSWLGEAKSGSVVLVEDILSAIRVGNLIPCVSSIGTTISMNSVLSLSEFDKVVIWYDDDRGGRDGSEKVMKKLALLTDCVRIRTNKDPKLLSNREITQELAKIC